MFLDALKELGSSSSRGIFIDSCYEHDQITVQETWLSDDSPALDGTVRYLCHYILFSSFLQAFSL